MATGRDPVERDDRTGPGSADDARRKLIMTLVGLAILLAVILFVLFYWWNEEGDETDDEDVTRITIVSHAQVFDKTSVRAA